MFNYETIYQNNKTKYRQYFSRLSTKLINSKIYIINIAAQDITTTSSTNQQQQQNQQKTTTMKKQHECRNVALLCFFPDLAENFDVSLKCRFEFFLPRLANSNLNDKFCSFFELIFSEPLTLRQCSWFCLSSLNVSDGTLVIIYLGILS